MLAASTPFFTNQAHPNATVIPYSYYDVNLMVSPSGHIYPASGPYHQQNPYFLPEFPANYCAYGPAPMTPSPTSAFPSPVSPTGGQTALIPFNMAGQSTLLPEPSIKIPQYNVSRSIPMPLTPPMTLPLPPSATSTINIPPVMVQPQAYPPGPPPPAPPPPPRNYPPQPPDEQFLQTVFQRVNRDKSGRISASELQSALSNGTWKPFNPETIRIMIGMFDKQTKGKINFEEFCKLWKYVTDWLYCFQTFDIDESGNIDQDELKLALNNFGYRLTDRFFGLLVHKFDRDFKGAINFDDFIQCCIVLQGLTSAFRAQDKDQDGWVRMTYEQFLLTVFKLKL